MFLARALMAGSGGVSYKAIVLADKPLAFWPLNETSGTVAKDISGNGFNMNLTGDVTLGQAGPSSAIPQAMVFDGSTGYADYVGTPAALNQTASIAVEAWVKVNTAAQGNYNGNWFSYLANDGYRARSSTLNPEIVANNALYLADTGYTFGSTFAHVVFLSNSSGTYCYINGELSASNTTAFVFNGASGGSNGAYIGQTGNSSYTEFLAASIAMVAVYPSLTAAQILAHYNAGIA